MAGRLVLTGGLVALLGAIAPASALAQPSPRVSLTWTAPPACPNGGAIVTEVDRILGDRGARPTTPLVVDARVTGSEGAYVVEVRTTSADGPRSRSLRGKSCAAVADATALVIALAIDPNAVPPPRPEPVPSPAPPTSTASPAPGPSAPAEAARAPTPSPPGAEPAASPPAPKVAPKPPPKPEPRPAPPRPIAKSIVPSFRLQAWGGGEVGALPAATPMFGGEAGVVLVNFRMMLGGEALLSQKHRVQASPSAGGVFELDAGYLEVGYTFVTGKLEVGPLAGLEIGILRGSGVDNTSNTSGSETWEAARVGGFAGWFPVSRFGLVARVEAAIPFSRRRFIVTDATNATTVVAQPAAASGRLTLGAELRL